MQASHIQDVGGRSAPTSNRTKTQKKQSGQAISNKARILVVEDEIFVAWHLESVLQDLDYAVCGLVPDGESAVETMDEVDADLVLMDINLKGSMDGIEAARRIRETAVAPIIFITAYSDPQTLGRIEKTIPGAPVLAKPVAPARLRTAIEQLLESRH